MLHHRPEDADDLLGRVCERSLHPPQLCPVGHRRDGNRRCSLHADQVPLRPRAIGSATADVVLHLIRFQDSMLLQIHAQELPRPEFAVLGHAGRIDRHRPGLGTREHPAIARERIAHGTQPAPIQDRPEEAAVSEDERRGTIPGLRQAGVVPVQRPVPRRQFRVSLPCLRHQHHHGVAQVPAGQVEQLRRVIQHAGVRGVRVDHRKQRLAKGIRARRSRCRARIQATFPCSVLISPLWARRRKGCARLHAGRVLVLYRWW